MKLHALSQNNRYFLFEDELLKTLKVYKLFNTEQEKETWSDEIKPAKEHEEYEFVPQMTIDLEKCEFVKLMQSVGGQKKSVKFGESASTDVKHEEALRIINDPRVSKFVTDDGSVYFFSHRE